MRPLAALCIPVLVCFAPLAHAGGRTRMSGKIRRQKDGRLVFKETARAGRALPERVTGNRLGRALKVKLTLGGRQHDAVVSVRRRGAHKVSRSSFRTDARGYVGQTSMSVRGGFFRRSVPIREEAAGGHVTTVIEKYRLFSQTLKSRTVEGPDGQHSMMTRFDRKGQPKGDPIPVLDRDQVGSKKLTASRMTRRGVDATGPTPLPLTSRRMPAPDPRVIEKRGLSGVEVSIETSGDDTQRQSWIGDEDGAVHSEGHRWGVNGVAMHDTVRIDNRAQQGEQVVDRYRTRGRRLGTIKKRVSTSHRYNGVEWEKTVKTERVRRKGEVRKVSERTTTTLPGRRRATSSARSRRRYRRGEGPRLAPIGKEARFALTAELTRRGRSAPESESIRQLALALGSSAGVDWNAWGSDGRRLGEHNDTYITGVALEAARQHRP